MVWQTAPIPMTPYQVSICLSVFQARVATRSPGAIPQALRALDTRRARSWIRP